MENINIAATERSPEVDFDFSTNTFALRGESYPEDVNDFFGPVMDKMEAHLKSLSGAKVTFAFELVYFNSSSAKVLMNLFELMDDAAGNGNEVHISWIFDEDDDNIEELGEEFCEDLEHATYELLATTE